MQPHEKQKSCLRWICDVLGNNNGPTCGRMKGTPTWVMTLGALVSQANYQHMRVRLKILIVPPPPFKQSVFWRGIWKIQKKKMCINVNVWVTSRTGFTFSQVWFESLTHRWQWGRCVPASTQMGECQRCRCSSLRHGSSPCGWLWRRCLSGKRQAPRVAVRSRCLFGQAGSAAGSGSGHPANAPPSKTHLDPVKHCKLKWKASPRVLPDAPEPLLCLIHKSKGKKL